MNKSKLYIHIGTHKTGSTAIQSVLSENQKKHIKENIIYLGQYMPFAKHIAYAKQVEQNFIDQTCRDLTQKIKRYSNRKNVSFVWSNETFCGDKLTGYSNANSVAEILHTITKNLGLDIYIVVYLRRQDKFLGSLYTQRIHNGASYSFNEFFNMFDNSAFHWQDLLQAYAGFFGKRHIIVHRYGKTFLPKKDSLIHDFGSIIQSKTLTNYTNSKIRNPGFSRDTLEIARLTNQYLDKGDSKKLRILLKSVNSKQPYEKYSFLDPQQRIQFMLRFKESNAVVAKEYFNEPSGRLFPAPSEEDEYEPYPGLTPQNFAVNLAKAIAIINRKTLKLEKEVEQLKKNKRLPVRKLIKRMGSTLLLPFPRLKEKLKGR